MKYTTTQQRIIDALGDGQRHTKAELTKLLLDQEGEDPVGTLIVHMVNIRKKIRPIGQDIICEYHNRKLHYRHVRLISCKD